MKALDTLSKSSEVFSINDSGKLIKFATVNGMTAAQREEIFTAELKINQSPSYLSFKARVVGLIGTLSVPVMASISAASANKPIPLVAICVISLVFFMMFVWGTLQRTRDAFAAAVLRAKASSLTIDQISVLKDKPELRGCRDTQDLLTSIQESKASTSPPTQVRVL